MNGLDGLPPEVVMAFRQAVEALHSDLTQALLSGPLRAASRGHLPRSETLVAEVLGALGLRGALADDRGNLSERSLRRVFAGEAGGPAARALIRRAAELLCEPEVADVYAPDVLVAELAGAIDDGRDGYDRLVRVIASTGLPQSLEIAAVLRGLMPHIAIRLAAALALAGKTSTKKSVAFEEQPFAALIDALLRPGGCTRRDLIGRVDEPSLYAWRRGASDPTDESLTRITRAILDLNKTSADRWKVFAETRRLLRSARALSIGRRWLSSVMGDGEAAEIVRSLRHMTDLALEQINALPIHEHLLYEALQTTPAEMKTRLASQANWSVQAREALESGLDPQLMTALAASWVHEGTPEAKQSGRTAALQAIFASGSGCLSGVVISAGMCAVIEDRQLANDVAMAAMGKWRERALFWTSHLAMVNEVLKVGNSDQPQRMAVLHAAVRPNWPAK